MPQSGVCWWWWYEGCGGKGKVGWRRKVKDHTYMCVCPHYSAVVTPNNNNLSPGAGEVTPQPTHQWVSWPGRERRRERTVGGEKESKGADEGCLPPLPYPTPRGGKRLLPYPLTPPSLPQPPSTPLPTTLSVDTHTHTHAHRWGMGVVGQEQAWYNNRVGEIQEVRGREGWQL